jgi:two-component system response regulator GlrR
MKSSIANSTENPSRGSAGSASVKPDILLVDDDPGLLELLDMRLQASGFGTRLAGSGKAALSLIERKLPNVIISDLKMDHMDGLELLALVQKQWPTIPVIILTAHGSIPDAVLATRKGVFAFLTKPVDKDELLATLKLALDQRSEATVSRLAGHQVLPESKIVTRSPRMYQLIEQARAVAQSDVNILINGESGSGKELLANEIHERSDRAGGSFIGVNCGAIPAELMESELFGYKKGAFTGAMKDHKGLFQAAEGGTLFLDEVGDMPLSMQVKLLRVLQEKQIRPVGSTEYFPMDVRVVSATHKDLGAGVKAGTFREDLYYRLNVVSFMLPALRERKEDIPLLVSFFLQKIADRTGKELKRFSDEAIERLLTVDWPGNIRQLHNVVEQAVALCSASVISRELIDNALPAASDLIESLTEAKKTFEKVYCENLLRMTNGNIPEAARLAGRNRSDFYKIVRKHGINVIYDDDNE